MRSFLSALAMAAVFAAPAAAQDHRVFVNLTYGGLAQNQDVNQTASFPLYGETGTWEAAHAIEAGPFFDIGGGFKLHRNFFVGASFTQGTTQTRDVTVNAVVPGPIFFDTFRSTSGTLTGLEHKERALHLQALLQIPVTVEFGVSVFGGPTFFTVEDELVSGFDLSEAADFSSVALRNIRTEAQSNTSTGFHLGFDAQYMFVKNAGVGGMVRYSKGSVELTAPADTGSEKFKLDTGGLEIGAGLRFRF